MRAIVVVMALAGAARAGPRVIDVAIETDAVDPTEVARVIELPAGAHVVAMRFGDRDAIAMRADRGYARYRAEVDRERDPALLEQDHGRATLRVFPVSRSAPARVQLTIDDGPIAPAALYVGPPPSRGRSPVVVCSMPIVESFSDRSLTSLEIRHGVRLHTPAVRACYSRALQRDRALAGALELHFVIGADGAVAAVAVDGALAAASDDVRACVAREVATWRFREGDRAVAVGYPLIFEPPAR
jgi:hypothetical protein